MKILAIDTATESVVTGVVEYVDEVTELATRSVTDHRRHAEVLTTLIREVLDEAGVAGADLDAVVVGCGPGPFTGLRVGMATAAAYGDALGLPVHGVGTLDALSVSGGICEGPMLVVTDARRREVYTARYDGFERVGGPDVSSPDVVAERLAADPVRTVIGPARFGEELAAPIGARVIDVTAPAAAGLVAMAIPALESGERPGPLEPLYLRRPDAVELKDQRRKSLLPVAGGE